jgi:hypothetical protein
VESRLTRLVAENYPRIATDLFDPLVATLQLARDYFGGDLDSYLMLLVITIRTLDPRGLTPGTTEPPGDGAPIALGLGTNVRSVADSLGIPKETARRKIQDLLDTGWVTRHGGQLYFTERAQHDLAPLRLAHEALAVHYYQVVSRLNAENELRPTAP